MTKYTIKDLAEGRCAVIKDGTLDELRKVINLAFPTDVDAIPAGNSRVYFRSLKNTLHWDSSNVTELPVQSVKDFLVAETTRTISVEQLKKIFDFAEVCTQEQFEVFNEVFCKSKHVIYDERLRVGSIVKIKHTENNISLPVQMDLKQSLQIVLLNSPYIIVKGEFVNGGFEKQITLYQNGAYCCFCSDENLDFITEVIEY